MFRRLKPKDAPPSIQLAIDIIACEMQQEGAASVGTGGSRTVLDTGPTTVRHKPVKARAHQRWAIQWMASVGKLAERSGAAPQSTE